MRFSWLSVLILVCSSPAIADEHRWFVVNDTDAACEALDGPHAFSTPMPYVKTPAQVLALKRKDWPDAKLVSLIAFAVERHIPDKNLPVDLSRITKANAFVVVSAAKSAQLLLLRDDACSRIDSDAR
jgi:hypothetical protein